MNLSPNQFRQLAEFLDGLEELESSTGVSIDSGSALRVGGVILFLGTDEVGHYTVRT